VGTARIDNFAVLKGSVLRAFAHPTELHAGYGDQAHRHWRKQKPAAPQRAVIVCLRVLRRRVGKGALRRTLNVSCDSGRAVPTRAASRMLGRAKHCIERVGTARPNGISDG